MPKQFGTILIINQIFGLNWGVTDRKPKDSVATNNCVL